MVSKPTSHPKRNVPWGISVIPVKVKFETKRVKIYIDSPAVPGWNEIDAVGLRDGDGKLHWAVKVAASTTYAQQQAIPAPPVVTIPVRDLQRLVRMEAELKQLRKDVDRLKALEAELLKFKKQLQDRGQ